MSDNFQIYKTEDEQVSVDVRFDEVNETVWLSANQMAQLFGRDKSTISRHIKNVFEEKELERKSVVANFATTASDGKRYNVDFFNLDVIISVGYRVKSVRGTQFRQWATKRLNEYIRKGFTMDVYMTMQDWADHLDGILTSTGEQLLQGAGSISHAQAIEKAHDEYRKYQERTLSNVEKDFLETIRELEGIADE